MKVLIIIPAYNEEQNIKNTVEKVLSVKNENMDYVVINDGSTDKTLEILQQEKYKFINLEKNLGIGGAVQTGYKYAYENDYDIAIQFDGDGQHNEEYLEFLIKEIKNGNDLVIGSRFCEKTKASFTTTTSRKIGIKIISFVIKIFTGTKITDPTSGLRACNKKIIEMFSKDYPKDYPEPVTTTRVLKKKLKVKEVPVIMNKREFGISSINFLKSIDYMVKVTFAIIATSIKIKMESKND